MTHTAKSPPAATGGARRDDRAGKLIGSENIKTADTLQRLRAAWISRRCAVSPDLAILLSSLALGEGAR